MPSPFPGMDPYLEHPSAWPNIHHRLITAIADVLAPQLLPKYQIVVEERIYQVEGDDSILIGAPDVTVQQGQKIIQPIIKPIVTGSLAVAEPLSKPLSKPFSKPISVTLTLPETIRQSYLEIREIGTAQVVTVIEVLSPVNKRPGKGRIDYENKRSMVFASSSNFVEIDLLRQWKPLPVEAVPPESTYRILVSAQEKRPQADLYAFNLPDAIPNFPLPLRSEDICPVVDLRLLLDGIYDRSGYGFVIDYHQPPIPALSKRDTAWMQEAIHNGNAL
jgi:Protein of unknown function (DUF4058)